MCGSYIKVRDSVSRLKLFMGVDIDNLNDILSDKRSELLKFGPGDNIYSSDEYRGCLGILLSGSAQVRKRNADDTIILNQLYSPKVFGAAGLFQKYTDDISQIISVTDCTVLFIHSSLIKEYMQKDFKFVENYLTFLSERVRFLNKKIDCFTQSNAEAKLAFYLLEHIEEDGFSLVFQDSFKNLAKILGLGRASLYRALDVLIDSESITRDGKIITILDKQKLKKFCK